jgi:hypothetical protein
MIDTEAAAVVAAGSLCAALVAAKLGSLTSGAEQIFPAFERFNDFVKHLDDLGLVGSVLSQGSAAAL